VLARLELVELEFFEQGLVQVLLASLEVLALRV
jgi:hypothetical protein